jgi:hypothetical protein
LVKAIDKAIGHTRYTDRIEQIRWAEQASLTPGHKQEDPTLRSLRAMPRRPSDSRNAFDGSIFETLQAPRSPRRLDDGYTGNTIDV